MHPNKVHINCTFKVVNNSDKSLCKVFFAVVIVTLESFAYIKVSKGSVLYVQDLRFKLWYP